MNPSDIQAQNGSSRPGSEGNGIQGAKNSGLVKGGEHVQATPCTSERVGTNLGSEVIYSEDRQVDHATTRVITTTTTGVKERKSELVQEVEQSAATSDGVVPSFASQASAGQLRYEGRDIIQNAVVTDALTVNAQIPVETRQTIVLPSPGTYSAMQQRLLEIERIHRAEMDRAIALMTDEHEAYERFYEQQFATFRTDNARLRREISASASQVTSLQNQLRTITTRYDKVQIHSVITSITTSIVSISTTITTVTSRIEKWKQTITKNKEEVTISVKELEQLSLELSNTSSEMVKLQEQYAELSRDFGFVRHELQVALSLHDEKDRTIAALSAAVAEWKNSDDAKAERIATARQDYESFQRGLSAASFQIAELQKRHDAQSKELASVRGELQANRTLVEEKEYTIITLTAEVDQWKQADATKAEQFAVEHSAKEELQQDLETFFSQTADLQKRYDAQSADIESIRNELQAKASLLEEKEHAVVSLTAEVAQVKHADTMKTEQIASLTAEVEQWKRSDASKVEELTIARKNLEELRHKLVTSSAQITEFQQRCETQSTEFTSQIEGWKRSDATKAEELAVARKDLEQLRRDLSTSSSQTVEYQQRLMEESAGFTAQIEQWKRSDTAKTDELVTMRKKLEQLQVDLTTASSRVVEFQQRCEMQSTEFTFFREYVQTTFASLGGETDGTITEIKTQIERWRVADAARTEELARAHSDIEQLRRRLTVSSSQIEELQTHHSEQLAILKTSTFVSAESRQLYESITTEVKDYAAVIKLTATIEEWLRADARRAENLAAELTKRNRENEELRRHLIMLKEMYIRSSALKEIFQSETITIQRRYEEQSRQLKSALAERQSRLDDVERFVTTADAYADAMIIQVLQKLNAEVQKSTTFMAEFIVEDFLPRAAEPTKEQISAAQHVSESIGQALAGGLGRKQRDDVALYLAIAFQAYITYSLCSLISSWTTEQGYNDLITKTYEQLQKSEAQMISGRWRSLTRTYLTLASMSDPNTLVSTIVTGLSDIVVAAGCAPSPSAATSKLSSKFGNKMLAIISLAGQLSKMVGEVVSADFQVLAVRPSQLFEEATMEEDVDDDDKVQGMANGTAVGHKVLCSTHMGMTKRMQLASGKTDTLTVIKPKVVLESFLEY